MRLEIGVDPRGIGFKAVDHGRRKPLQRGLGKPVKAQHAHPPVERESRFSDDFGQSSGAHAPHEFHLKEPVLGVHVAQGEIGVPFRLRADAGDPVPVADDRNRRVDPGKRDGALGPRPGRLDREPGPAHNDERENDKPGRDAAQPGTETASPLCPTPDHPAFSRRATSTAA